MNKLITITSDFGDQFASAQLRAIIASLGFKGDVIENHSVSPFSIEEGAFELLVLTKFSPKDSIHVGVVDPEVGSNRKGIIIKTKKSWFVGPDNGLLCKAATSEGVETAWQLQEAKISKKFSNTFHGRDIFVKAAVYIAKGKQPEEFGSLKIDPQTLRKILFKTGQVLHVDHYGNIKIHWVSKIKLGQKLTVRTKKGYLEIPFTKTFSDVPPGKPLAFLGSSETLELAVNLGKADRFLSVKLGDVLLID